MASIPTPPSAEPTGRFQTTRVAAVALLHFIHDIYTSLLAPLLPLLIQKLQLSLTQAGSLTVVLQLPSLLNPFFGMVADRRKLYRLLLGLSPATTAVLLSLIGLAPNYTVLLLLLLVAGFSVPGIHISGPVMIARVAGDRLGRGMGMFMVGGELARSMGPIVAVWAVSALTLEGLWMLAPVGVVASAVVWWRFRDVPVAGKHQKNTGLINMLSQMRGLLTGILGVFVARSFMAVALMSFLPTYLVYEGRELWISGVALSVFEAAGAVGVLTAGSLSDRWGRQRVLAVCVLIAPLALLAMMFADGAMLFVLLVILGLTVLSSGPVMMALMVENAGENQAAANGIYWALNFAIRALTLLLVGIVADAFGLRTAFFMCAGVALVGAPFVFFVPQR
jgi:MFS transporter, FSR family, fosmidomycin resistance protein